MKTSWSKRLFVASDIVIAIYLALAFVSLDKKGDSKALCSKVNIDIADNAAGGFLDAKVIKERLQKSRVRVYRCGWNIDVMRRFLYNSRILFAL